MNTELIILSFVLTLSLTDAIVPLVRLYFSFYTFLTKCESNILDCESEYCVVSTTLCL